MGRPTKIEGNPEHPASLGATDSLTQAAVLGLYDPDRAQTVTYRGEVRPWSAYQNAIQSALTAQKATRGRGLRILTEPITSPSLAELVATVLQELPASHVASIRSSRSRWRTSGPAPGDRRAERGRLPPRQGRRRRLARRRFPRFRARDGALHARFRRSPPGDRRREAHESAVRDRELADADGRQSRAPATDPVVGYRRICAQSWRGSRLGRTGRAAAGNPNEAKWVAAIAKDLQAHRGRSVVMAGEFQPPAVHALAHAINQALGNVGTTVTYGGSIEPRPISQHASLFELATAMDAGQVQLLIILGNNPAFTAPADVKFVERLGKVGLVVYHSLYQDETSEFAHWNIPDTHPLETWGDPRAYDGTVTLMQPLIAPLYDAHSAHEVIADAHEPAGTEDARSRQGLLDARVRRRHGMDDPQRRRRVVRQCRRLLEAGRPRRVHSRHRDRDGWAGHAVQAGARRARRGRRGRAGCGSSAAAPRHRHQHHQRRRSQRRRRPWRLHRPRAASSSCSGPIRWSGTAASPTTAGCRKRPSR